MPLTAEAIAELFDSCGHLIYRRCRRLLGDEPSAEDALQEIFLAALRYRQTFADRAPPLHWVQRLTTNHCLRQLKRRGSEQRAALALATDDDSALLIDGTEQAAQRRLVVQLLAQVDERTQQIAVCTYLEGLLHDETAELLGISARAVRKRLARFRLHAQRFVAADPQRAKAVAQ